MTLRLPYLDTSTLSFTIIYLRIMSLTVPGSTTAQPEWQNVLKERMMAQQTQDEVHKELIGNCESVRHKEQQVGETDEAQTES